MLCTVCMSDIHRGQKKASNALGLDLGVVVNLHVEVLETESLCKSSKSINYRPISPPLCVFYILNQHNKQTLPKTRVVKSFTGLGVRMERW